MLLLECSCVHNISGQGVIRRMPQLGLISACSDLMDIVHKRLECGLKKMHFHLIAI